MIVNHAYNIIYIEWVQYLVCCISIPNNQFTILRSTHEVPVCVCVTNDYGSLSSKKLYSVLYESVLEVSSWKIVRESIPICRV